MFHFIEISKLVAGVAIFLLGMLYLEEALKQLAGRPFKLFLKRYTSGKLKAILGGAIVTGVLQSSSVVNLMVLAFVGAGVIKMQNALAVILGANFGTTLDSWVVATAGFKFNIENFALPVTGVFGILMILTDKESRWHKWSKFLFGISFLFVGLNYMKTAMSEAVKQTDFSSLSNYPAIVFVLTGLLITSLIQSSSATIAIVLSALHANAITLFAATAVVLGSEIGTSIKLVLASVKGLAVKKRVAMGNFLFNCINVILVFIFLQPINHFITGIIGIKDNLMALVFFQSLVNVIGIILFYPFLNMFAGFLEKRFNKKEKETSFIHKVKVADIELAVIALEKELRQFIFHLMDFALSAFEKNAHVVEEKQLYKELRSRSLMDKYEYIKQLHGEIHAYCIQLHTKIVNKDEAIRLQQLISALRNTMYAAKSLKDAYPDIEQLRNSSNDVKYNFYRLTGEKIADFYGRISGLLTETKPGLYFEELAAMYKSVTEGYTKSLQDLYKEGVNSNLNEVEISTLLNFNREIYTSLKSIIFGIKEYLLNEEQANYFDDLPGFIR